MRCPKCGRDLGDGMLPARCPSCGHNLANAQDSPGGARGAERAAASRASIEGLTGYGRGRKDSSRGVKRVTRIAVAFVLIALFVGAVYVALYESQIVGGVMVPYVRGWGEQQAAGKLADKGFASESQPEAATDEAAGRVVSQDPPAGKRADRGSTVTLHVAQPPA